ncbi:MAG: cytochrome c-type biogenesis protein [Mixta calida]|jgi:cytochrome c-type biogenesis protein CcmH|uniref:Cytochrome c-type biogenesis protein n=1 Tax=Mixta calida TaxID=665913 RepID=A0ABN5HCA7_9GAMM|nr:MULTISPECIES: cytochrome c-type biogenesis protein [Mixta]AIX73014.1 cytochrome C [Pantoea sp. PSNIH2]MBS6056898.1 cytochrome c-type biogenesis protein CcmH [Pantoea sp.]POU46415.1 cytochrome c-type biogenesis protein CcmH [Pantoea sp. PSNIH5]POU64269.1 cytochrome c-type biogenesis protein CcmH [Pantoea sp. PSNIH4]POY67464.1 cytochrome c-type biogenesis protein CcmH [Pantoea sp. PSNIH3]
MRALILLLAGLLFSLSALATIETWQFDSAEQEQQYRELTASLRCPKCQNNSIADSNAMIAADMRLKVYQLLKQGQSGKQITQYMVARYGNFVTYQPPVIPSTLILWAGPLLFIVAGGLVIFLRSRRLPPEIERLDEAEQKRLAALLESDRKSE